MAATPPRLQTLRLLDFSDRELLLIVDEVAAEDGWADSQQLANRLGLEHRRTVSSRLSWLARYGIAEREEARDDAGNIRTRRNGQVMFTQRWRLTQLGHAVAYGRLKAAAEKALDGVPPEHMVLVAQRVARAATQDGGGVGWLVKREWTYGTAKR